MARWNTQTRKSDVINTSIYKRVFIVVLLFTVSLIFIPLCLFSLEIPLELHGQCYLGKYLNSDTSRYNMDASIDLYCTMLRQQNMSMFVRYRDDLDMAAQTGGVSLDPRYAHYYIVTGLNYTLPYHLLSLYFMHDCIHDIDIEVEGTPVFNRFRMQFASDDFHHSRRFLATERVLWSIEIGVYPHWQYHGWDINAGADYEYEAVVKAIIDLFRKGNIGASLAPQFHVTRGDTCWYHQHKISLKTHFSNDGQRIGLGLDYNIWNTDIIKDPDKLWLLSIFVEF